MTRTDALLETIAARYGTYVLVGALLLTAVWN
jgi:hypothetical protein